MMSPDPNLRGTQGQLNKKPPPSPRPQTPDITIKPPPVQMMSIPSTPKESHSSSHTPKDTKMNHRAYMLPTASSRSKDAVVPRDQVVASSSEEKGLSGGGVDGGSIKVRNYTDIGRKLCTEEQYSRVYKPSLTNPMFLPSDGAKEVEAHKMQRQGMRRDMKASPPSIELAITQKRRCRIMSNMTTTERERALLALSLPPAEEEQRKRFEATNYIRSYILQR